MSDGDSSDPPLTAKQRALVERGVPFADEEAAKLAGRFVGLVSQGELQSAGYWRLTKVVRTYVEADEDTFESYVRVSVRGAMLDKVRSAAGIRRLDREAAIAGNRFSRMTRSEFDAVRHDDSNARG